MRCNTDGIYKFSGHCRHTYIQEIKWEISLTFSFMSHFCTDIPFWRKWYFSIEPHYEDYQFKYFENHCYCLRKLWNFWWRREIRKFWELYNWNFKINIQVWKLWELWHRIERESTQRRSWCIWELNRIE